MKTNCWLCQNFNYRLGKADSDFVVSEYHFEMNCKLNHWEFPKESSKEEFLQTLLKAENCKEFKKREKV